jgi:hypothetical protein
MLDTACLALIGHLVYFNTITSVFVLPKSSLLHLLTSLKELCGSIGCIARKGYLVRLIHLCLSFLIRVLI